MYPMGLLALLSVRSHCLRLDNPPQAIILFCDLVALLVIVT